MIYYYKAFIACSKEITIIIVDYCDSTWIRIG